MVGNDEGHGQYGHGVHGAQGAGAWMEQHLGGLIMPFGERVEKVFESMMSPIVNGLFAKAAVVYLAIFTPVLLVEFLLHAL